MTQGEFISFLSALVGLIGGILVIWFRVEKRINDAAAAALLRAETAMALARLVSDQLAESKIHAAETFVTKSGLREATEQLMGAIGDVKQSMTGLTARMDRIIEDRPNRTP